MAKKGAPSKNTRAARRGQEDPFASSETQQLSSIPRLENTDTVSSLIRASIGKNQQLLNDKLSRIAKKDVKLKPGDHIISTHLNKKKQHMVSKTVRTKQHRFNNIDGRFGKKIENALNKKKIIGNLRKTGWDKINEIAKHSLTDEIITQMNSEKKTNEDVEAELYDEMKDDNEILEEIRAQPKNPYDILADEE